MLEEIVVKMSEDLKSQNLKSFYNDFLNKLRLNTESTIQYLRGIEKSQKNIEEEIIKNETLLINENLEENESNLENKYFEFKHIKVMELNEKYEKLKENYRKLCLMFKNQLEKENEKEVLKLEIDINHKLQQEQLKEIENNIFEKLKYQKSVK